MGNRKQPFGYRMENGETVIHPQEAEAVRLIFRDYLSGIGFSSLANKLNEQNIEYYPDKPWNKNMVARLLEDSRYAGDKGYPVIIANEMLATAAALRNGKCAAPSVTPAQKVLRRLCGQRANESMERQVLRCLNRLIENPALIQCPQSDTTDTLEALKQRLDERMKEQPVDEAAARPLILRLAAERYEAIGDAEYETERLRDLLGRSEHLNELDADLLLETVSSISEGPDGKIIITLKNGQTIEGGKAT